jgi:hypothetical protein
MIKMWLKNKIAPILKDKSGASLLFVLGVMMLLLSIGASVMAAASANIGSYIRQREFNQVRILGDSVHRSIRYSLGHDPENPDLMSQQIVMGLYEAHDSGSGGLDDIELRIGQINGVDVHDPSNLAWVEDIVLSFPSEHQKIDLTPEVPEIPPQYDDDGTLLSPGAPGIPKTAAVDTRMEVTIAVSTRNRSITTRAVYEYTGGVLSEDADELMRFLPGSFGIWRLVSYGNVD